MEIEAVLWRHLDTIGHDACRLLRPETAWRLDGAATFLHEGVPACLVYDVGCDDGWRTRNGVVHGWMGSHPVDFRITRAPDGVWTLNGRAVPGLEECLDLDFGFTPATNLFQVRRMALQIGESADCAVAWMDVSAGTLDMLHQRYERRTADTYWYEAPRFNYSGLLQISAAGFVEKYPGLWEIESG